MRVDGAVQVEESSEVAWLLPRFTSSLRKLTTFVPDGYPALCRVLHRAGGPHQSSRRWSEIASHTGAVVHPAVQWHRLIGSATTDGTTGTVSGDLYARWHGYGPPIGELDGPQFHAVAELLTGHTGTADEVYVGFWEGCGHFSDKDGYVHPDIGPTRFRLGGRDQIVMRSDLAAVAQSRPELSPGPNAMWPADRSWYLATEVDFDSTIIAGSHDLLADLLAHSGIEALEVPVDLDLTCFGDTIN